MAIRDFAAEFAALQPGPPPPDPYDYARQMALASDAREQEAAHQAMGNYTPPPGPSTAADIAYGLPSFFGKIPSYIAGAPGDLFGLGMQAGGFIDRNILGNENAPSSGEIAENNPFLTSEDFQKGYEDLTGVPFYVPQTTGGQIAEMAVGMVPIPGTFKVPKHPTWRRAPKPSDIAASSADLPSMRGRPIPEAIAIAEKQPHLIPGGESTRGAYVGGPADIQSYDDLRKLRERVYDYIAKDPRGGDWYDRYRAFLAEVTGADPLDNKTMSEMQALMSAGVDPGSELGFAMKELNGAISGFPVKAARPAQHAAVMKSAAAQRAATTPAEMAAATRMAIGKKTGAYANQINPNPPMSPEALVQGPRPPGMGHNQGPPMFDIPERIPGSTGVNDFRYANTWEMTEATGGKQKGALTATQHKWIDYETTLMVDAANRHNLGGRSNWSGEQLQAAPWVRQKALDLMSRRPKLTYETAIDEAMKTIADFAPSRTLSATHEARPGVGLGYIPELDQATNAEVQAYSSDPRRSWATAPGGRDAVWAGTGIPNVGGATPTGRTGFNARVRPTIEMQGAYQPQDPTLPMEFNRGEVARPMVGIDVLPSGRKQLPAGDRAMGTAAETFRALVDVQRFGGAHIPFVGGKVGESGAWVFKMPRSLTEREVQDLTAVAKKYGYGEVVDRGEGVTIEKFGGTAPILQNKTKRDFMIEVDQIIPGVRLERAYTDSVYADMADKFLAGEGSGKASQEFLDTLVTPELYEAFDNNPYIAEAVLNKIEADRGMWQGRGDVEVMRRIVASGKGWVARLEQAVKDGTVPSILAAGLFASMLAGGRSGQSEDKS